jgi:predicted RNA-binding Zn ribbon-like protein
MRKRQQAPERLELVRAFVNTFDIETGAEELSDPAALERWLAQAGLWDGGRPAGPADLRRAQHLRESLREILLAHNALEVDLAAATRTVDDMAQRARLRICFDDHDTAALEPLARGVDGAIGRLLAIVATAMADGTWERLKACREHTCEFAFYDRTKNRSGAWCTMEVCGNRAKARAYRERQAGTTGG